MSTRSVVLLIVAAAVLIALALGLRDPAVPVEQAVVENGPLRVYVEEDAQTRFRQPQRIAVPVPGMLSEVVLKPGDRVEAGQTIAVLAPTPAVPLDNASRGRLMADRSAAEALAAAASARLQASAAALAQARREAERALALREAEVISAEQAEREQLRLRQSEAEAAAASAQVRSAQSQIAAIDALLEPGGPAAEPIPVRAYRSGLILRRLRESAGPAAAGEVLVEIGDPAAIEVVAELLSEDAVRLAPGNPVSYSQWGGESTLTGVVETIEPAGFTKRSALGVEEQRVRVIAVPDPNAAGWPELGDAYRLRGRYQLWAGESVLQVNAGAIQRDRDGWSVLRIENGRAQRQPVRIGHRNDQSVEIIDGLAAGDRVVVYADDRVDEGARVEVVR